MSYTPALRWTQSGFGAPANLTETLPDGTLYVGRQGWSGVITPEKCTTDPWLAGTWLNCTTRRRLQPGLCLCDQGAKTAAELCSRPGSQSLNGARFVP